MHTLQLQLPDGRTSKLCIGEQLSNLSQYTSGVSPIIITDAMVYKLYRGEFPVNSPVIIIKSGEENKTLATIEYISEQLIELNADRNSFLVGIGGGIVCDVAGFSASIFMRGLRFGFVSTTLLAQVDASVGGKNGVNFNRYKNILGVFNQPDFVLCYTDALKTLAERELKAGLAEVVKVALITDYAMFEFLEQNHQKALQLDADTINYIVKRSIEIKAAVVEKDEREAGERRKLNLGHTFGHAIEKHGNILHGEGVSIGMVIAAKLSQQLGLLTKKDMECIIQLLKKLDLPVTTDIPAEKLLSAITKDKKKQDSGIHFVFNKGIGDSEVRTVSFNDLNNLFTSISEI